MAAIIGMRGREREGGVSNRLKEARPVSVYEQRYCINVVCTGSRSWDDGRRTEYQELGKL